MPLCSKPCPSTRKWPDFLAGVLGTPFLWPQQDEAPLDATDAPVALLQQTFEIGVTAHTAKVAPHEAPCVPGVDVALPLVKPGGAPPACRAPPLIHDLQAMIASHIPIRPAWIQGPLLHMSPFEARWLVDLFSEDTDRRRYTVFECRLDVMNHVADPSWSLLDYITAATRSVPYRVRLVWYIIRPMRGLPVPQFALTAQTAAVGARAIPVDLRGAGRHDSHS